jgi:ATP-dependent Zn protease
MASHFASPALGSDAQDMNRQLSDQWRRLRRAATIVAVLTSPAAFSFFHLQQGYGVVRSVVYAFLCVIAFRGLLDLLLKRYIPWPSLFGTDDARLREEDVVSHRRAWTWRTFVKWFVILVLLNTIAWMIHGGTWTGTPGWAGDKLGPLFSSSQFWIQIVFVFFLFIANFGILMGPMLAMGISQIRGFEPGDAQWGVKLDDVRGQAEAKEEVRRVVNLWQSGEAFERAGGKRERGLMFLGAPGTGKTMLAKAIATGFNSPFVSIPGSGFAQTFIGIDAIIVRFLARKAKRLARKWGGTCIVFIDEIDAVGMRRSALGGAYTSQPGLEHATSIHDVAFYGDRGALTQNGDVVHTSAEWRERIFRARAEAEAAARARPDSRLYGLVNQAFPGMFGGGMGQLALQQLLVVMDGMDNPPFLRRIVTNRVNTLLDAVFVVPVRVRRAVGFVVGAVTVLGSAFVLVNELIQMAGGNAPVGTIATTSRFWEVVVLLLFGGGFVGGLGVWRRSLKEESVSLRLNPPRPRKEQVYFIGATNVPLESLDPALTRPGRMGRHVWFRTPTKDDRKDVFDLYLAKVAHEESLDTPEARDELARMTNGYSPAMIDQVCSMALTHAQHDGRMEFSRKDLVEAMTTIEAGTAIGVEQATDQLRATAIHEAGHAVNSFLYQENSEATRLTIKMRGSSFGHLQTTEKEERFGVHWRSEFMATLTMIVGAMAAEYAFYGENGNGVGGDLGSVTNLSAMLVGQWGMGPEPLDLQGRTYADETEEQTRERIEKRFEKIGLQLMNRTAVGSPTAPNPIGAVLGDPTKRATAAQMLGQAFVRAYNTAQANRAAIEHITDVLLEKRELYGDEVIRLLEECNLHKPEYDLLDEKTWPIL